MSASLRFTVGTTGELADLERLLDASERIAGVYTGPPMGCLGGGRRQHAASWWALGTFAARAHARGVRVEIAFNAPDVPTRDHRSWWTTAEDDLRALEGAGVDGVIVAHPFLLEAARAVSGLTVAVSTIAEVKSARMAGWWASLGADRIVLSAEMNKDPEAIRRTRRSLPASVALTLMANEHCLGGCPWRPGHYLCTAKSDRELDYHMKCKGSFAIEPWRVLANNTVRPEDIHLYTGLVDEVKILGRAAPIDLVIERVRAYDSGVYEDNYVRLIDHRLAEHIQVPNAALEGLLEHQWRCGFTCHNCSYCANRYAAALD